MDHFNHTRSLKLLKLQFKEMKFHFRNIYTLTFYVKTL